MVFTVGETLIESVPAIVVAEPHEPVPHSNMLPSPAAPPLAVKVVELPEQIVSLPVMLVGAVGAAVTVTVNVAQEVVVALHTPVPFRRTQ